MPSKVAFLVLLLGACNVDPTSDASPTQGLVEVATVTGGNSKPFVHAHFTDALYGPVVGEDGACTVHDAVAAGPRFSAGTISIAGTTSPITLHPDGVAPSVQYEADAVPSPLYAPGASITIHIDGSADVGAAVAVLFAPGPLLGFTSPPAISRAGYTATWTRSPGYGITLLLATPAHLVECHAGDTGSFTIPASTFALLPASETTAQLMIGRSVASSGGTAERVVTMQVSSYVLADAVPLTP